MASNYPGSLDSYTALTDNSDDVLAAHQNDRGDAIEALEVKVGADTSAVATSIDYFLKHASGAYRTHVHDGTSDDGAVIASVNGLGVTASTGTLTVVAGKTITLSKTMTLTASGDSAVITLPNATETLVGRTTTDILTNKTLTSPVIQGLLDGWILANESWAYASATTITVPTGAASIYSVGDKLKLTQTTVKYFYVTAVADTVLTVTGGSDYTVANAAITANYYSKSSSPVGFPQWFAYTPNFYKSDNATGLSGTLRLSRFSLKGRTVTWKLHATAIANPAATYFLTTLPVNPTQIATYDAMAGYAKITGTGSNINGHLSITDSSIANRAFFQLADTSALPTAGDIAVRTLANYEI